MKSFEYKIHILFIMLFWIIAAAVSVAADRVITPEITALLDSLDAELAQSAELEKQHVAEIDMLRQRLGHSGNDEQRYWISSELYAAYSGFDSDSALVYADKCYDIARRLGRRELMNDVNMNRTYIYSATGLLSDASRCLAEVDTAGMSGPELVKYYKTRLFMETHIDQFLGRNAEKVYQPEVDEFLTRLCCTLPENDPDYFWLMGWHCIEDSVRASVLMPQLSCRLKEGCMNTEKDAREAWMMSRLCELNGDSIGKMRYLIYSAIADTRICNKEIASLEEIGAIMYQKGYLERANSYLSKSIQLANSYKSRVRVGHLANLQDMVFNALYRNSEKQLRQTRAYMTCLLFIFCVLCVVVFLLYKQLRQNRGNRRKLAATKISLEERVAELQDMRTQLETTNAKLSEMYETARASARELAEVNDAKENYIANIFSVCSNYIGKMDDFRKNIYRMIVAKRIDDVYDLVKSPELSHGEIKELYANFDRIFLEIYPDFVQDFNTLLRPGELLELRKDGLLTTELRIYALVRLGMNDSVKIAKFLHCSVQTVYNTRQRIRNKAAVPRETFAERVRSLGKPVI